jgi:type IV secretory pathway TrbF-like protein
MRSNGAKATQAAVETGDGRILAARHEFVNAFGDLARGKRNWQIVAFSLLALLGATLTTLAKLSLASRVVPYVIEVDKLGQITSVGPADVLRVPSPGLVSSQLAGFVRDVRTVLPAQAAKAQVDLMTRAYSFVDQSSPAAGNLNTYFADPKNDPRILGQTLTREVRVTSVLPVPGGNDSGSTWKLRWTETEISLQTGVAPHTTAWEGYLTVKFRAPTTVPAVQMNPLGLFVSTLNWTEIVDGGIDSGGTVR